MLTLKSLPTLLVCSILLLTTPVGCKNADRTDPLNPTPARALVKSALVGEYSESQLRNRFTGVSSLFQVAIRNPIQVYRIEYNTTNTDGKPIVASGALIVRSVTW